MGKIYSHLKVMNKVILKNRLSEDVDCVSFFHDNKKFEIFFTRKRANKS